MGSSIYFFSWLSNKWIGIAEDRKVRGDSLSFVKRCAPPCLFTDPQLRAALLRHLSLSLVSSSHFHLVAKLFSVPAQAFLSGETSMFSIRETSEVARWQ